MDADREQFVRDNAPAIVDELEAKIARQSRWIRRLEASRASLRAELARWRNRRQGPLEPRFIDSPF